MARRFNRFKRKVDIERNKVEEYKYWASLSRQVAPVTLEEDKSGKYLFIDNSIYCRTCIIGVPSATVDGYPRGLRNSLKARLMGLSSMGCVIALPFRIIPISGEKSTEMIQKALFLNEAEEIEERKQDIKNNAKPSTVKRMRRELNKEHNESNFRKIAENDHKMFTTQAPIIVWGKTKEDVDLTFTLILQILESEGVNKEFPDYYHKEVYMAAMPYTHKENILNVELLSPYVAVMASATNPNSATDDDGIWFCDDKITNKHVLIDPNKLAAFHLLGVGATRSGKTFMNFLLLMRAYSNGGYRIIYTTAKPDEKTNHRAVVDYFNGTIIDIGRGLKNINPLQIMYDRTLLHGDVNDVINLYHTHKQLLFTFFELFDNTISKNMLNYLDLSLNDVYKSKGIYADRIDTWEKADWPVMSDLVAIWKRDLQNCDTDLKKTIGALLNKSFMFLEDGALSYMNQPTNVDISNDFMVIDLANVPNVIRDAMYAVVTGIMGLRFRASTDKKTIICVDEARVFLYNKDLNEWLMVTLTQGGARNMGLWLLTQQASDLTKANVSEEFITNSFIKVMMGANMGADNIKITGDFFHLDEDHQKMLLTSNVGEGLIVIGKEVIPAKFTATELEKKIIRGDFLTKEQIIESEQVRFEITPELNRLGKDNYFYLRSWSEDSRMEKSLLDDGYERGTTVKVTGTGKILYYVKKSEIVDGHIGNQTLDHYATVMQMAGLFLEKGMKNVKVEHYNGADVSFEDSNGLKYAIEYEREKIHTQKEIIDKSHRLKQEYDKVFFVCASTYYPVLSDWIGELNTLKRGAQLEEFIDGLE